jgi:hypothetical protein
MEVEFSRRRLRQKTKAERSRFVPEILFGSTGLRGLSLLRMLKAVPKRSGLMVPAECLPFMKGVMTVYSPCP